MSEHTDELVGVEYVADYADAVVVATLMELGGAFYAASDHSVPEGTGDVADVYRPAYVHVDRILGGATGIEGAGRFAVPGSELKVRVPGGRIGCDEYRSDRIAGVINPGERWVLFLDRLPSVDGEPVQELTVVRTWRITSDGLVVTGDGERISLDEFEERAATESLRGSPTYREPARRDVDLRTRSAVDWLLGSKEPAIRRIVARDVLGKESSVTDEEVLRGPIVRALLDGQQEDGGFGGHPYKKWTGAHWRLVSLVELGVPEREGRALRALEIVLDWLTSPAHRSGVREVAGRIRLCASLEGNAVAVASRLGVAQDPRVTLLGGSLVEWQWPDGGWNCDRRPQVTTSSVHESLAPAWGLWEYARATGDADAARAARCAAESFLERRIFRSRRTGDVMHPDVVKLHWPPYWHYDILRALVVLQRMELVGDPRAADALDLIEERRLEDGRWRAGGVWRSKQGDVVDWGGRGPSEMLTLHALTVLRAAGRL